MPFLSLYRWAIRNWLWCLFFILGTIARLYSLADRPWDSDELGALFRAQNAQNFGEHMQHGVAVDGHPAGVQTLLFFNEHMLHLSPLQLKYVWVALSLLGIVALYGFFNLRKGTYTALFVSISWLVLWWPISISVWVRPYTLAFLFLYLFLWSYEFTKQKHSKLVPLSGIFLALTAYTHYMALLGALVFLFFERYHQEIDIKTYFKIQGLALLLFLPHISVFQTQWSEGGLSWLAKPQLAFIREHLKHMFNPSFTLGGMLFVMGAFILFKKKPNAFPLTHKKECIQFLGIWLGVFMINFVYSWIRKPVLQHNSLYFTAPFLLAALGLLWEPIPKRGFHIFALLWGGTALFSLVTEKQFYRDALIDRYAHPIHEIHLLEQKAPHALPVYLDGPSDVIAFHLKAKPLHRPIIINQQSAIYTVSIDQKSFEKLVFADTAFFAFHAGSEMNLQTHIFSHYALLPTKNYPSIRNVFPGGEYFKAVKSKYSYLDDLRFFEEWVPSHSQIFIEFQKIESRLGEIKPTDILMVSIETTAIDSMVPLPRFDLVTALFQEGFNRALQQIDYRYVPNDALMNSDHRNDDHWLHAPLKLADIPLWDVKSKLRLSFESRNRNSVRSPESFRVRIRKIPGNPQLYGISQ
jgi:hypothetical protein